MELHWKFYKAKKEGNEAEYGEDIVGWGRHKIQTRDSERLGC